MAGNRSGHIKLVSAMAKNTTCITLRTLKFELRFSHSAKRQSNKVLRHVQIHAHIQDWSKTDTTQETSNDFNEA